MAIKFGFIFVAVLVVMASSWVSQASLVRREAPAQAQAPTQNSDSTKAIEDAFESFKSGLGDFVKTVQDNGLVQNITQAFKQFGNSVQQKGEELVNKLKADGKIQPEQ